MKIQCPRVPPTIMEKKVFAKSTKLYQSLLGLCPSYIALIPSSPAQTREHTYLNFDSPLYLLSINMPKSSLKNKTDLEGIKFQNQSFPYQSMNMLFFMNGTRLGVLPVRTRARLNIPIEQVCENWAHVHSGKDNTPRLIHIQHPPRYAVRCEALRPKPTRSPPVAQHLGVTITAVGESTPMGNCRQVSAQGC